MLAGARRNRQTGLLMKPSDTEAAHRFAIYYAPSPDEPLGRIGPRWLGRDARSGAALEQPRVEGVTPERLAELTAAPRRYGFHATLKAPFRLAEGHDATELRRSLREFTLTRRVIHVPRLMLTDRLGFPALVPAEPCPELDQLAADCVRVFDLYRAAPTDAEIARRKADALTPSQRENLTHWGYPYVFEDFRFHMTLGGAIPDAAERAAVMAALDRELAEVLAEPLHVRSVCLFVEPKPESNFKMFCRDRFG